MTFKLIIITVFFFIFILLKKNFFLTFIFETERDRAWTGEGQREGDTECETGSRLWAVSTEPDAGLKLTALTDREVMTWAEVGRLTDWATQAPPSLLFWSQAFGTLSGMEEALKIFVEWVNGLDSHSTIHILTTFQGLS